MEFKDIVDNLNKNINKIQFEDEKNINELPSIQQIKQ